VPEPDEHQRYYNEIAGSSRARLDAISDGIFAVCMTLLVLTLAVPTLSDVGKTGLTQALVNLLPGIVTYVMSFLTLGIFWVGQQTQLSQLERTDRDYTWIMLAFLLFVTLVPFSTALLARFYESRTALIEYWLNIVVLGTFILAGAEYAARAGLFKDRRAVLGPIRRRVYTAQALYAGATALCLIDTRLSIALIVLIQLNYAIAPRVAFLRRL
jgi:uncharacterized membrane protein